MKDPKKVFTNSGYENWRANMVLLEKILFEIDSNADDLWIGDDILDAVGSLREKIQELKDGGNDEI